MEDAGLPRQHLVAPPCAKAAAGSGNGCAGNPSYLAATRLSSPASLLQAQAAELSVPNEFGALLQRQGAVGLNAATSQDATKYYVSLTGPS